MRSVTAYATPAAKAPFEKVTIERRDLGPHDVLIDIAYAGICHSDIHPAREEWGDGHLPAGAGPRDRRHRRRGRLRGHQVTRRRPRRRRLHGRLVPRVRELPGRRGAVLPAGQRRHLQRRSGTTAEPTQAATPRTSSSTEDFVLAHPRGHRARRRRAAAVRRHHAVLAAAALGRGPGQPGRHRRHGRARATWASRSRTRSAPR